jgi:hypothetical protein
MSLDSYDKLINLTKNMQNMHKNLELIMPDR